MSEICIFAGTTEGRRLAEFLRGQPLAVLVCVATEYGEALIPTGENIEVNAGRLDEAGMEALLRERRFDVAIDATHPFAEQASRNIRAACSATGTEYLRLNRDAATEDGHAVYVTSIQDAADFLARHAGVALLTTGSKELGPYAGIEGFAERFYVRVLPTASALAACEAAGFAPARVIAMQGPFSVDMNVATLRAIRAEWLVTKDSGNSGGFREKIEAARIAGARCVVIGRPTQADGMCYAEVVTWLMNRYGLKDVREIDAVGIGMGSPACMTVEADEAFRRCDCIIGAPRMLEATARYGKPAYAAVAPERILEIIAERPEHRRVAVALSGDAGFFSGAKRLLPLLEGHRVRVIPGLSTLQVLCARLRTGWEDVRAISLHGREGAVAPEVARCGRVFALTDGTDALRRVCAQLCAAGLGDARVTVGQRLSYPDEVILRGSAEELKETDCAPLSALLIEHPVVGLPLPVGLPDGVFLRQAGETGRTVPMTKSEVRAVSISKLRLTRDAVVWDIGAGTGSVSVEAASLCPMGHVHAVECREDAAALIEANAEKFGLRNLSVVRGTAPDALSALPTPTHAFIGGSSGSLEEILRLLLKRNAHVRIVVNAIAPETVGRLAELMDKMDFEDGELIQLSVARGRRAGRYHLMEGLNPIWIAAMQDPKGGDADEGRA